MKRQLNLAGILLALAVNVQVSPELAGELPHFELPGSPERLRLLQKECIARGMLTQDFTSNAALKESKSKLQHADWVLTFLTNVTLMQRESISLLLSNGAPVEKMDLFFTMNIQTNGLLVHYTFTRSNLFKHISRVRKTNHVSRDVLGYNDSGKLASVETATEGLGFYPNGSLVYYWRSNIDGSVYGVHWSPQGEIERQTLEKR